MAVRSLRALSTPRVGSARPVLDPSRSSANKADLSSKLNCICGLLKNKDNKQTIPCSQCKSLSHLHCAHLTVRTAKKITFVCHNSYCKAKLPKASSISSSQPSCINAPSNLKLISHPKAPNKQIPPYKKCLGQWLFRWVLHLPIPSPLLPVQCL